MCRADSELMAADIYTKPFPEAKRVVWYDNLKLINIYCSTTANESIDYQTADKALSLRGDMKSLVKGGEVVPEQLDYEYDVEGGPQQGHHAPGHTQGSGGGIVCGRICYPFPFRTRAVLSLV